MKIFKTALSLLACAALLFSGCKSASPSLPNELQEQKSYENPESLNILASAFFQNADAANYEEVKQTWLDDMSTRYGVQFNILCDTVKNGEYTDSTVIDQRYRVMYGEETFPGLIEVESFYAFYSSIYQDVAMPLDDYLADNQTWNALPEEIKSMFKVDGHIYAIPTSISWNLSARMLSNESLQKTIPAVTDLNSLKKYATSLSRLASYDGVAIGSDSLDNLIDILNAYGLYVDSENRTPIAYDPGEESVVDFLTKDNAVTAFEYLRELYAAGALDINFDRNSSAHRKFNEESAYASFYTRYHDNADYTEILTLNPANPQVLTSYIRGFIMTKDTPQPKETINFLVDMLFGSADNYYECRFGSPDNYTKNSDGTLTLNLAQMSDGSEAMPAMPNLVGNLPGLFPGSDGDVLYSKNGVPTDYSGDLKAYYALLNQAITGGTVVKLPISCQYLRTSNYYLNLSDLYTTYIQCIAAAITDISTPVSRIVDDYRIAMNDIGGNLMLDEMNAAIGKKTAYYYD